MQSCYDNNLILGIFASSPLGAPSRFAACF